ncbi:MAG: hypothetical protein ACI835_001378 [Planctomycetota bacterium]|jgi:hypothetical protein
MGPTLVYAIDSTFADSGLAVLFTDEGSDVVTALAYAGDALVTAHASGTLLVRRLHDEEVLAERVASQGENPIESVFVGQQGKQLLVSRRGGSVTRHGMLDLEPRGTLMNAGCGIPFACSPDGAWIAFHGDQRLGLDHQRSHLP